MAANDNDPAGMPDAPTTVRASGQPVTGKLNAGKSATGKCPICGAPRQAAYRPFCSKRCADVDLGRWLNGSYAIPASEEDPGEADLAAAEALADAPPERG